MKHELVLADLIDRIPAPVRGGLLVRVDLLVLSVLVLLVFLGPERVGWSEEEGEKRTFTNPVAALGADPWVIQWEGDYYYCFSRQNKIWVSRFAHLEEIGKAEPVCVWTPPAEGPYSRELWAPELHYVRGAWYVYVAADDGRNENHRMQVLEGGTQNPQEPFTWKATLDTPRDRWAIDGTVLQMPGDRLYFIWSGWEGTENVAQYLYIAPMHDPWTIEGERVCISKPELVWELNGNPLINEGPQILKNGEKVFIIYSASGSWTDHYCLGQLTWTGGDVLDPGSWVKKPEPVFRGTDAVFGPGHASFVPSADGKEQWIVYHSARYSGAGWKRQVNMQPFAWNEDGSPCFGTPIAPGTAIPAPERIAE